MSENEGNNQLRNFTQKELESFDGKEGLPFYVVFKGKVRDLSKIQFGIQGTHMGIHTRNENLAESIKKSTTYRRNSATVPSHRHLQRKSDTSAHANNDDNENFREEQL
jgi:predicted heme/steroid binding protein